MKELLLLFLGFSLLLSASLKPNSFTEQFDGSPNTRTPLVKIGEQIFQREGCLECHTLRLENKDEQHISLDGYGNTRPTMWLYYYLTDPKIVLFESVHLSYLFLEETRLDKATFIDQYGAKPWSKLIEESDSVSREIIDRYPRKRTDTELIALIAFLQQIPATKELQTLDSIAHAARLEEMAIWDQLYKSSDSLILSLSNDPANIEDGKRIFLNNCTPCHNPNAKGNLGPDLTDDEWIYGGTNADIMKTILAGSPNGMPAHSYKLTQEEVAKLVSYIRSLQELE